MDYLKKNIFFFRKKRFVPPLGFLSTIEIPTHLENR